MGRPHSVGSAALNACIAEASGSDGFTAKTFRTWAAKRLHNTPAIARKSYIHPDVIALCETRPDLPEPGPERDLTAVERRLLAFLRGKAA